MKHWTARSMEVAGIASISAGLWLAWPPAAFVFAGAAVVFLAQGVARDIAP